MKLIGEASYVIIGDYQTLKLRLYPLISSKFQYKLKMKNLIIQNIDHENCDFKMTIKCNNITQPTSGDFQEERILQLIHVKSPVSPAHALDYIFKQEEYTFTNITDFFSVNFKIDIISVPKDAYDLKILQKCKFYLHFDILTYLPIC